MGYFLSMHPRNPYKNPPDFKELALKFPEFRKQAKQTLTGKIEIDFKDAAAVRTLSTVLLKRDFDLDVELPPDRLVPTLPLRLNYLLWIEDLLEFVEPSKKQSIHGIDVGTGACCIYPILAAKKFGWNFTATETDETNYICSTKTLEKNNLQSHVTLKRVTPESMLSGNIDTNLQYDFTMCNPPFFDSDNPSPKSRSEKRPLPMCPRSGGSASASEIAVKGGEVQFVKRLIAESQELKSSIKIFTSMLGHKSSLTPLKIYLKEVGASSCCETEFRQGRTTRWGLAWTYFQTIALDAFQRNSTKPNSKSQPPLNLTITSSQWADNGEFSIGNIMVKIASLLSSLKISLRKLKESKTRKAIEFTAKENTWSNQRRKRREEKRRSADNQQSPDDQPEPKKAKMENGVEHKEPEFCLKGLLLLVETDPNSVTLQMQWLEGGSGRESINQILQYMKNHLFNK
uniref:U6 small nuclear RNA (adenine-(43)-N(6))-methyltransferase n=1 Tax=Scapholeberis mucronata TaxID=202097 RepID=A0A4Y7NK06_9CRUS|nr:EOG090X04JL [Scapholeberis mucronata]SVE93559.1 EOG090X04JL [Scapholeberis mucronata]